MLGANFTNARFGFTKGAFRLTKFKIAFQTSKYFPPLTANLTSNTS